jgi:hypothetical protein
VLRRASLLASIVIPLVAAVGVGLAGALLSVLARGSIGPERLAVTGASPLIVGGVLALEFGFGMTLGIYARRFDIDRARHQASLSALFGAAGATGATGATGEAAVIDPGAGRESEVVGGSMRTTLRTTSNPSLNTISNPTVNPTVNPPSNPTVNTMPGMSVAEAVRSAQAAKAKAEAETIEVFAGEAETVPLEPLPTKRAPDSVSVADADADADVADAADELLQAYSWEPDEPTAEPARPRHWRDRFRSKPASDE